MPRQDEPPQGPSDVPRHRWWPVLRRSIRRFRSHNLADWAAALTYYGVLSLFPALLALVSVVGLLGADAVDALLDNLRSLTPGPARDLLDTAVRQVRGGTGEAGVALAVGVLLALWSASGYVAAFIRAANAVYGVGEGRPAWQTLPLRLGLTLALLVLLALTVLSVVLTGSLADRVGEVLGIGDTAVTAWNYAKWPALVLLVSLLVTLLYRVAPDVRQPGLGWLAPGSLLAVVLWLAASAAFAGYVANFDSYNRTYGSLATVVVFLVWLWLSHIAVLLGLEFNVELERDRAAASGHPVGDGPVAEPRDTRGRD